MNVQGNLNIHLTIPSPSSLQLQPGMGDASNVYSESENYSNQLLRQGRGFPLYAPKPCKSHPAEYRRRGVTIGDVGTVTPDGNFDFFFNIYRSADDPVNTNVPEGFVPLSLYDRGDVTREDFDPGDYVARLAPSSIRGINDAFSDFEMSQKCAATQRNTLKAGTNTVNDIRGRGLVNGSLYLVTGCEKAESWGIATFHDVASQNENEFQLSFAPTVDAGRPPFQLQPHRIPTIITHLHFPLAPPPIPHSQPALLALLAPEKLYKDSTLAAVSPDTSALIPTSTSGDGNDSPDGSFEFEEKPPQTGAVARRHIPARLRATGNNLLRRRMGMGMGTPTPTQPRSPPPRASHVDAARSGVRFRRTGAGGSSRGLVCEYAVSSENATGTGVLGDNRDGDVHMPSADMAATERTRDGDRTKRTACGGSWGGVVADVRSADGVTTRFVQEEKVRAGR
ncbi:hypothetical protein B0H14DRAFT_3878647 [Mycena olivaceomarginata]|nr:hypothetical protein B0H14DRAFT_3878647 [Mycena olivaceomarginata]